MLNNKENIRIINLDSIILLLIVFLGLLIYNDTSGRSTERKSDPVSNVESISQNSAISNPGIQLQVFQKTWISNKDNFKLLAFNRIPSLEDKKINQKISHLQNIRKKSKNITGCVFRYHLFPAEKEEVPVLS